MHTAHPPFAHTSGPRDARTVLVGEAWGQQEALTGLPFIGTSGQELTRMLAEAGIARRDCLLTNVFAFQPQANNLELICVNKATAVANAKALGLPGYYHTHIKQGKYIDPQYLTEVTRLYTELDTVRPNIIVALGNTACWALLGSATISALRGTTAPSQWGKVLPTYHPAAVLRQWAWRPIVIADLLKVARERDYPEIRRPERSIITDPTLQDIEEWLAANAKAHYIAADIETKIRQIEMIGFAASPSEALVIPFIDRRNLGNSYWPTPEDERRAWDLTEAILCLPAAKVFQNGLFDLQYIARMGLRVENCLHDPMLLHHSIYPEMKKSLGFMGSIYTQEASWKLLRNKHEELKRDE